MSVRIEIFGDNAAEAIEAVKALSAAFGGNLNVKLASTGGPSVTADTGGSSANITSATTGATTSESTSISASATNSASPSENDGQRDAAGTLFDPARHTGTKVKSGLWRMKTGLSRGPGEGEEAIPQAGATSNSAGDPPPPPPVDEDDEFAAFRAAATDAPAAPTARTWSDADLSKLCNQAAVKDGSPARVKPIITKYIPEGQTDHSRNIPVDKRETFAREVETTIGITYEG